MYPSHDAGGQAWRIRVSVDRKDAGYCGLWIHFFDMKAPIRRYIDATDYQFLSFWVRGAVGGEQFKVKLADQHWIEKEDSITVGDIGEFLDDGVTTEWQEVIVALEGDHGLQLDRLGGLTLDFDTPGTSTIFIDNIALTSSRTAAAAKVRDRAPQPPADVASKPSLAAATDRAIWLWSTEKMLDDTTEADAFFHFCQQQGIKHVWAQLLYDMQVKRRGRQVLSSTCVIRRESALRRFLQTAHAAGLKVHALEGYPEHAQRQYHYISLGIVDAVLAFNQDQPTDEQFDGVHFDNEPHLLLGWHDPQRRKQILFEFLTLNSECQRKVAAASPRIQFGIDIPFWWHHADARSGDTHGDVFFRTHQQSASLHLLEMLDNVGVMNYRDAAQGADGMIALGRDLLVHADNSRRAKVFMGVETCSCTSDQVLLAVGKPRSEFELAARGSGHELAMLSRLNGNRIQVFDDGQNVHVGIQVAETDTVAKRAKLRKRFPSLPTYLGSTASAIPNRSPACKTPSCKRSLETPPGPTSSRAACATPIRVKSICLSKPTQSCRAKLPSPMRMRSSLHRKYAWRSNSSPNTPRMQDSRFITTVRFGICCTANRAVRNAVRSETRQHTGNLSMPLVPARSVLTLTSAK